ncbi:metal ABC transporter ATP-binding protein [Trueperella bialowiezensis]|uniref:Zinc import ATP-binding protein ZnuC n=1 Tax=Trueperella bialowiezensis TaxID=312285 RepID=A0A3S4WFA4_9ACTO|nr:metal ABC transporter ATP-binding protein [Trueperella bialowiezensis]VEI12586.1 Zinc import ATP-binding protein ZnuC [Trueperella bialowiezensis]
MTTAIKASGVHVQLGSAHILLGIDFELAAGRTLAIVGANGSGKSTLVRALVGAIPISAGRIELYGQSLASRRKVDWARIGYAPQRVTATSGVPATALEAVMGGLIYGNKLRPSRGGKERALAALDQVGLAHRAHESVQTFSGGQQQRILTARALVRDPDMLILDEPFAGVDTNSRRAILDVLHAQHDRGKTIVLVLHEIHEYLGLVDEALILDGGRVREHTDDVSDLRGSGYHANPLHDHAHEYTDDPPHYRSPYLEGPL